MVSMFLGILKNLIVCVRVNELGGIIYILLFIFMKFLFEKFLGLIVVEWMLVNILNLVE